MDLLCMTRKPSAHYVPLQGSEKNLFFQGPGDGDSNTTEKLISVCPLQGRTNSWPCCYQTGLPGSSGGDKGLDNRSQVAALNHEKEAGRNYLKWHAGWNCCQESLSHRNLQIWLKE